MAKMSKFLSIWLVVILVLLILFIIAPANAQVENLGTYCIINTEPENITRGKTFAVVVQMSPAPPAGERYNDLFIYITSMAQGVSGYGPWDAKDVVTDTDGMARVNFNIGNYDGYIFVNVYFGGQYFSNNTIYYTSGDWNQRFLLLPSSTVSPTPSSIPTPKVPVATPIPSVPEFPITATLIAVLAVVSLLLIVGRTKQSIKH